MSKITSGSPENYVIVKNEDNFSHTLWVSKPEGYKILFSRIESSVVGGSNAGGFTENIAEVLLIFISYLACNLSDAFVTVF